MARFEPVARPDVATRFLPLEADPPRSHRDPPADAPRDFVGLPPGLRFAHFDVVPGLRRVAVFLGMGTRLIIIFYSIF